MAGSKKEQTQIVIILLLVLVWVGGVMLNKNKNSGTSREESLAALKKTLGIAVEKSSSLVKEYKKNIQDFVGKRDPFQKPKMVVEKEIEKTKRKKDEPQQEVVEDQPQKAAVDRSQYDLQGIVWGGKNPVAIISGEVVAKGDMILGAKVLDVKKTEVILNVQGQKVKIEMEG